MRKISLFALAVMMSAAVIAQESAPQLRTPMAVKTRFGLRAGLNRADLTAKDLPSGATITEAKSNTSFNAGAFVNIPLSGMLRFQPELSFSSQGGKLQGPSGTNGPTYEQDLHYINLPLMFQLQTAKGFFVETGPQLGYLVKAARKSISSNSTFAGEVDNKSSFDHIDFAWSAGLGILSRAGLGVDARFNLGIADIMEDNLAASEPMKGTWKNNVAQVSLIYQFGANK